MLVELLEKLIAKKYYENKEDIENNQKLINKKIH